MSIGGKAHAVNRRVDQMLRSLPKMASDLRAVRRRVRIVGVAITLGLVGMGVRASDIAIDQHELYAARGNRQQLRSYTLPAGRGNIVDRNYVSMAVNDHIEHLVLNPRLIHAQGTVDATRDFLHRIFAPEHHANLDRELDPEIPPGVDPRKARKAYRRIKVRLDPDQARAIRGTDLPGLRIERRPHRVYPRGALAAHVLGRVDGEGHGNLGVELAMDRDLRGHEASSPAYYAGGKKLLVDGHPEHGVSRGDTVALTIDTALQSMTEEEIDTLVENWRPVGASVIVLDPWTGEVLAMANRPTFDPNHRIGAIRQTVNLASQGVYEPGSTVKAITVAAALEEGTIRKNQTFFCEEGRYQYTPQHAIRDTKPAKWLDVTEILAMSSNIGTTKIYSTLGKQAMHRWVRRFHFGERPDVQLPGATPGLLADWEDWSDIKGANVSFGQGLSASPLQVASAFAALSNGGVYNAPTVVSRVLGPEGELKWEHTPTRERVVRVATANTVLEMLTAVVHSPKGTGKNARVDGYRVAGKTSTAQKANPKGGYYEDQYYASFVGTLPADDPRVVILVSVDNPEGGHYGNEVAAPTFARLGARIMTYYGVPRNDVELAPPKPVSLDANAPELVEGFASDEDVEPTLPGRRKVAFDGGLPDFSGLTIPEAIAAAEAAGFSIAIEGTGVAVGQDQPPGGGEPGSTVTVFFAPPA